MTVVSLDLKAPSGELRQEYFPAGDLDSSLTQWLIDVEAEVSDIDDTLTRDKATTAWIYWKAFTDISNRMAAIPQTERYYNDVERSWGGNQLAFFRAKAEEYYKQFLRFSSSTDTSSSNRSSFVVRNRAVW